MVSRGQNAKVHNFFGIVFEEQAYGIFICFQVGYVINGVVLRPARVVVKQWAS